MQRCQPALKCGECGECGEKRDILMFAAQPYGNINLSDVRWFAKGFAELRTLSTSWRQAAHMFEAIHVIGNNHIRPSVNGGICWREWRSPAGLRTKIHPLAQTNCFWQCPRELMRQRLRRSRKVRMFTSETPHQGTAFSAVPDVVGVRGTPRVSMGELLVRESMGGDGGEQLT